MSWKITGNLLVPQQAVQAVDVLPQGTYYVPLENYKFE